MTDSNEVYQKARLSRDKRFDGRFFVAVKSTGIFCRPICPAPAPKEQNVEYYLLAPLAMQAGYRPCLRCRPDSAPGSCAWKGVNTTVDRAIKLLKSEPQLSITDICLKLGVSDRYLRDLFQKKLGISPKKFRLYDQLLFAKHLLHNSALSVEHIAQASGFSTARRLQQHLHQNVKLTPTQIRKADRSDRGAALPGELRLQLAYRAPYCWPHIRDFLAKRAIAGVEQVTDTSYQKNFHYVEAHGQFLATHDPTNQCFEVKLWISELSHLHAVVNQIRRVLDLDADPQLIEQSLLATGLPAEALLSGVRLPGVWDLFEAGCRAILGQQISVTAAIKLVTTMTQYLGSDMHEGKLFPTATQVAKSDLAFLGMPQKRRDSLIAFSNMMASDEFDGDTSRWLAIKGVGPWTVAYANMRGVSEPDVWLATDLIIKKQMQKYGLDPDLASPWRSYLTIQLWSMA